MPQVSKRFVDKKVQERIFSLFISGITMSKNKDETKSFIEDLLTPTERLMLAKRFTIAYLLLEKYDYVTICSLLKVSKSTIGKVSMWLQEKGDGYRNILNKIKKDEKNKDILKEIDLSISKFLASIRGQNWSNSQKNYWQRKRNSQKPF